MTSIPNTGGIIGSAAGAPLSQSQGSDIEKNQKDSNAVQRQEKNDKKASDAAGVGQTEQDEGSSDRDADGRRFWERNSHTGAEAEQQEETRQAKDPEGNRGTSLDLTG